MAGFSSLDDFINETTVNGKVLEVDFNKLTHAVTAQAAGEWYSLFHSLGNPTAGILNAGTNKSFQSLCEESAGAIRHGGSVSPDTKHLTFAQIMTAAATANPSSFVLVDLLGYYPLTTVTTTGDQATMHSDTFTANAGTDVITHSAYDIASFTRVQLTTTTTLPAGLSLATDYWTVRQSSTTSKLATSYDNAVAGTTIDITDAGTGTHTITTYLPRYETGAGVDVFVTPTTVMGAGTPNMRVTYTNSDGTAGKITPSTLPIGKTAAPIGLVAYSGTGSGKFGPAMPRAAGDKGVRKLEQLYLSATYTSGALSYVMYKRLTPILPATTLGVPAERDLVNQFPSMPRIRDGACLAWLMLAGAATPVSTPFYGVLGGGWG